ncbi:MAG: hypothetical protein ACP5H8_02920 [Candidatus Micrarchaeia archaeon]
MIDLSNENVVENVVVEEIGPESASASNEQKVMQRPPVLNAKVYKLKSNFVNHALYITVSYIEEGNKKRPFEVFINTKDLSKAPEYAVLTRLISAIFRKGGEPTFILEELRDIYDPNGGVYKEGRYVPSLYSEIADLMEAAFIDLGIIEQKGKEGLTEVDKQVDLNDFKICPKCNKKTLALTNGCFQCMNEECLYSKCS